MSSYGLVSPMSVFGFGLVALMTTRVFRAHCPWVGQVPVVASVSSARLRKEMVSAADRAASSMFRRDRFCRVAVGVIVSLILPRRGASRG